jgi:hypothetical protein
MILFDPASCCKGLAKEDKFVSMAVGDLLGCRSVIVIGLVEGLWMGSLNVAGIGKLQG